MLSMFLSVGVWVFRDARAHGNDQPSLWAIYSVVLYPFALLYYLYKHYRRASLDRRAEPPTKSDRFLAMWANASNIAFLGGFLLGKTDIGVVTIYTYILLGVLLPVMYLLVYRGGYRTVLGWTKA